MPPRSPVLASPWVPGLALVVLGLGLLLAKQGTGATAAELRAVLHLRDLPPEVSRELGGVLLVPAGALLVVLVRLTLGLRMLGPFRPLLIALGLEGTGLLPGIVLFAALCAAIALQRPRLQVARLPAFGRLSLLLSAVVLLGVAAVILGRELGLPALVRTVYFPAVVLCLAADGFARVTLRDGLRVGVSRGAVTLGAAVVLLLFDRWTGHRHLLLEHPELLLVETGACVLVASYLALRLLDRFDPGRLDSGGGDLEEPPVSASTR